MQVSDIRAEMTPNPNAWKFVLPDTVIAEGNATFRSVEDAADIPLAKALIQTGHVVQVYFFDNYITINQDGDIDWNLLADVLRDKIIEHIDQHDPASVDADQHQGPQEVDGDEALAQINEILDETVRPALQADGGDLHISSYDPVSRVLKINYQGACGSCPSATAGTMYAIQSVLQEAVDPEIKVVTM